MRDFITFIVKNIVDHPDKVILDQQETDGRIVFSLQVAKDDIGKVIGKNGSHAMALRTLLTSVAAKEGKRVQLEIAD